MSVSIIRCFLCWMMVLVLPSALLGQSESGQTGGAILHTQGGVWVNGSEAAEATAIFPGDELETRPGFSANLSMDGSTVLLQPESVAKFQGDLLELDHGKVSVGTSKSFKVKVHCITVVPVKNEPTQYDVTDVNGTVQVAAQKLDVNVDRENSHQKSTPTAESSQNAAVHEGEQKNYDESEICGAPARPLSPSSVLNPKWIAAGGAGAGILVWLLVHGGGGKTPVSTWQP